MYHPPAAAAELLDTTTTIAAAGADACSDCSSFSPALLLLVLLCSCTCPAQEGCQGTVCLLNIAPKGPKVKLHQLPVWGFEHRHVVTYAHVHQMLPGTGVQALHDGACKL